MTLRSATGEAKKLPLEKLSEADRKLAEELATAGRATPTSEKPTVGLMFSYEMSGAVPQSQPWNIRTQLDSDYAVQDIPMSVDKIDSNIDTLLIIHPAGIEDGAQFAIDQYLLAGGRVIAMLDPFSLFNRQAAKKQQIPNPNRPLSSTMSKLLSAWGIQFESVNVVADRRFMNCDPRRRNPVLLGIPAKAISDEITATKQIDYIEMSLAGSFYGDGASGLAKEILVHSSDDAGTISPYAVMSDEASSRAALNNMQASSKPQELVIQLQGKFKTAFPDGPPSDQPAAAETGGDGDEDAEGEEEKPAAAEWLKESEKTGTVVLIGDTDMITDKNAARVARLPNGQALELAPPNGNLALVLNLVGFPGEKTLWNPLRKSGVIPMTEESISAIEKLGGKFTNQGKRLDLFGSKITDAGLAHLKGLTGMQKLGLNGTKITDAGLVHLKGMTGLKDLNLGSTKATDAGLAHLKGLTSLQILDLGHTQITDAGLAHLEGLTGLRSLTLNNTQITDAGVAKLKVALPKCEISNRTR